jgi:hypothetical protein
MLKPATISSGHAFRQHGRTAGEEGGGELGQRDGEIAGERRVDDPFRPAMTGHRVLPRSMLRA